MSKHSSLGTLGDRLRHARQLRGLSQAELAIKVGCSQGAIGNIERNLRDGRGETVIQIAEALRVRYRWLKENESPMEDGAVAHEPEGGYASSPARQVPLLGQARAATWGQSGDWSVGSAPKVWAHQGDPGTHAFAFRVSDESMHWSGAPTFPEGTLLIVSPDRQPQPGDFVLARPTPKARSVTFKRLTFDGASWYLSALNPHYKPMALKQPTEQVIGVVVEYWLGGKL